MKAVDYIKMSLEMSNGWIMGLAADMKDSPMTSPTVNGGNHPLWCVGHLAYSEGNMVNQLIKGEPNPVAEWEGIFKQGTAVSEDAAKYPSMEEVLTKAAEIRAETMALIETLSDEDLDKPSQAEGELAEWFGTVGKCLAAIPIHTGFHGGQIADARRAAGRAPLMG